MNVLLVEDDQHQSDWIRDELVRAFPSASIDCVATEFDFEKWLRSDRVPVPDVAVLDVMLVYRFASPEDSQDANGPDVDSFSGGIRCAMLLRSDPRYENVPVVLYTVLYPADLREELSKLNLNIGHISKDSSLEHLVRWLRENVKQ